MAKKRKARKVTQVTTKITPVAPQSTGPSFSLEAIDFLTVLTYDIRKAIQDEAIEKSKEKKNIPRSTVEDVAKQLNLSSFMEKP